MSDVLYDALIARNAANSAVFSVLDDGAEVSFAVFVGRVAQLWRTHWYKQASHRGTAL
jgi:hypothetical protein